MSKNATASKPNPEEEDQQLKRALLAIAKASKEDGQLRRDVLAVGRRYEEDCQLKRELLALAKSGAPRPKRGTRLGNALLRFTTPPSTKSPRTR